MDLHNTESQGYDIILQPETCDQSFRFWKVLLGGRIKSVITDFYTSTQAPLKNLLSSGTLVNAMNSISEEYAAIKFKQVFQIFLWLVR